MLRKLTIIVVTLVVGITGLWILAESPLNPAALQHKNLLLAEQQIKTYAGVIKSEPRFLLVDMNVDYAHDAGIVIHGYVASEVDLAELKEIWGRTKSPVATRYSVEVVPEPEYSALKANLSGSFGARK